MFGFDWSEIALIGVVALVLIGPKDLPVAIKAVAGFVKRARRMAGEFQTQVDDLVREADLGEIREHVRDIRSFDIKGQVTRALDEDGSIRRTLAEDPLKPAPPPFPGMADIPEPPDPVVPPELADLHTAAPEPTHPVEQPVPQKA